MSAMATELTVLEQGLADRFKIPVPRHLAGPAARSEIRSCLEDWGEAIVKPDILAGRRGKAGAVGRVASADEALAEMKRIMGLEIDGKQPARAYLVEAVPAEMEIYTVITYNSSFLGPSFTCSLQGGVDIEGIAPEKKITIPVDVYKGLDAYQVSELLEKLECPQKLISLLARTFVNYWDLFISTGMRLCEVNPWRIRPDGTPVACDWKIIFDDANFKFKNSDIQLPEYPENITAFEEEMNAWNLSSHQGQAHVSGLEGKKILPILFGGGASTIITEELMSTGGDPIFLSDFGGNPPYERMYGAARICFKHYLGDAALLLILGGKANNTMIDVTFKAIADALKDYTETVSAINCPVVIGRGGPHLVQGFTIMKETLDQLGLPYVIFGPDTPVSLVADYAARLVKALPGKG
ncbi:ATP-grasp domain-containing protein [Planctomycetota bacterium]